MLFWIKQTSELFWKNYGYILVPYVLVYVIHYLTLLFLSARQFPLFWLVLGPIILSLCLYYCVEISRGNKHRISGIFVKVIRCSPYLLLTAFLLYLGTLVGTVLLIIPGVLFAVLSSMGYLSLIDNNLSPVEAIKRSIEITRTHVFQLFFVYTYFIAAWLLLEGGIWPPFIIPRTHVFVNQVLSILSIGLVGPFNLCMYAVIFKNICGAQIEEGDVSLSRKVNGVNEASDLSGLSADKRSWTKGLCSLFLRNYFKLVIPFAFVIGVSRASLYFLSVRQHQIVWLVVGAVVGPYLIFYYLQFIRNSSICSCNPKTVLKKMVHLLTGGCLVYLVIALGFFALIIPGIVITVLCSMTLISIVDKDLGPLAAIKYSVKITKPFFGELFILYLYIIASTIILQHGFDGPVLNTLLYLLWVLFIGPFNLLLYASVYSVLCKDPSHSQIEGFVSNS